MLGAATGLEVDLVVGRWVVETRQRGRPWKVIVEPDSRLRVLVIVTAYPVERGSK